VSYLHSLRNPIVHGDLKLSDILVDAKKMSPKLGNFGLWDCKQFFADAVEATWEMNEHQAPEVIKQFNRLIIDYHGNSNPGLRWRRKTQFVLGLLVSGRSRSTLDAGVTALGFTRNLSASLNYLIILSLRTYATGTG